jgi:ADP-ribose pyrophosphatase
MTKFPKPRVVHEGRHLRFLRRGRWEYVERVGTSGIVVIVPVTADDKLVLVEQFRVPVGRWVIELPAGLAGDTPGARRESLAAAARRELLEETGYAAGKLELVSSGPISAGLSTELITVYLARGVRRVARGGGDATEDIRVHAVPLAKVEGWLRRAEKRGRLVDVKVYAGLHFAWRRRWRSSRRR